MAKLLKATIYFCESYNPTRGAIGKANRLLRTKLPKQIDLNKLEQIRDR